MELLDIGLEIPGTLPPTIVITMVSLIVEFLEFLRLMEDVDIGILIPSNIPLVIAEFIIVVIMVEVDIGLNPPATLPHLIVDLS